MLQLLDFLLTLLHLLLIGFNLLGWVWLRTRKWHLLSIVLTAGSWLFLGIWYGLGYCPLTDWQWEVKRRLGEEELPNSFIKYFLDRIGVSVHAGIVDTLTAIGFVLAALISFYLNLIKKSKSVTPAN